MLYGIWLCCQMFLLLVFLIFFYYSQNSKHLPISQMDRSHFRWHIYSCAERLSTGTKVFWWWHGEMVKSSIVEVLLEEVDHCTGTNINMYSYLFFFLPWRQELTKVPRSGLNLRSFCFSLPSNWGYWYATPCLAEWHLMHPCFSWPLGANQPEFFLGYVP